MSDNRDVQDPIRARSDLVDVLVCDPENAELIASLIEAELRGMKTGMSNELKEEIKRAAQKASLDQKAMDNLLYWLTETSLDARQLILIRTIEQLLTIDQCRSSALKALAKISSEENVSLVMEWVDRGILTLNQAVYVLLFPDSTATLK